MAARIRQKLKADVVVVGAGAGGAAAAYRMAESGLDVVVLEDGNRYVPRSFKASYGWALNHIYADKGARVVEGGSSYYPMPGGKGVGGSTLINSAICFRAPDHVLNHWTNELGLEALSPDRMRPLYELVESTTGVVQMQPNQARANNLFVKRGAEKLGLEGEFIHRNAPGCVGCGVCHLGCPSGGKGSVDRNFVPMAEEHGARIVPNSRVHQVLVRRGQVRGVEARTIDPETGKVNGSVTVEAHAVVLAAGSVNTPTLLLENGLANSSDQVGRNLSIHPAVGTWGFVPEAINGWDGVPQAYAVFLDRDQGILLQSYNASPEVFFAQAPWTGFDGMRRLRQLKNLAMLGAIVSDGPNGRIKVGMSGRRTVEYRLGDHERHKLIRAMHAIIDIMFAAGATEVYPGTGSGELLAKSATEAKRYLPKTLPEKDLHLYASHPMGSCRMGVDPKTSVVSAEGQSHDVRGLYIADASLMPTSLGVNPQMTVMALGLLVGAAVARQG